MAPVGQEESDLPTQCHGFLLSRAKYRIMSIAKAGKGRSVADTVRHRDDLPLVPADSKSTLFYGNNVPLLGNCSKAAFLLDSVGVCRSSAARFSTGIRVDTIASCLLLADRVQEFINIAGVLLVAVLVTMLPFPTRAAPARFISPHRLPWGQPL